MTPVRKPMTMWAAGFAAGALAFCAAASSAWAQTKGASAALQAEAASKEDKTVSELVVIASKTVEELTVTAPAKCLEPKDPSATAAPPKVISSFPAPGATVRPGLVVVRMTFDKPMACLGGFDRQAPWRDPCPQATQHMLLSYDRLTVRTVCIVEPATHYGLSMNSDMAIYPFVALSGLPSKAFRLDFTTSETPLVKTVCDALAEDEDTARQIRQRRKLDCADAQPPGASGPSGN